MMMSSPAMVRSRSFTSDGWGEQRTHAHQIERGRSEDERPIDAGSAAVPQLPQQADGLHPTEALLDQFSFLLTDRVAGMTGRTRIDRTAAMCRLGILGDMGR